MQLTFAPSRFALGVCELFDESSPVHTLHTGGLTAAASTASTPHTFLLLFGEGKPPPSPFHFPFTFNFTRWLGLFSDARGTFPSPLPQLLLHGDDLFLLLGREHLDLLWRQA